MDTLRTSAARIALAGTLLATSVLLGCATTTTEDTESPAGIANPASEFCIDEGGQVEIRTDESGGEYGICIFDDGSECDEWAFYRGECRPGDGT